MNRRTVLRHAVKLAYATPLIVATVRMDQRSASASPPCDPDFCGPCEECRGEFCVPIEGCIPD